SSDLEPSDKIKSLKRVGRAIQSLISSLAGKYELDEFKELKVSQLELQYSELFFDEQQESTSQDTRNLKETSVRPAATLETNRTATKSESPKKGKSKIIQKALEIIKPSPKEKRGNSPVSLNNSKKINKGENKPDANNGPDTLFDLNAPSLIDLDAIKKSINKKSSKKRNSSVSPLQKSDSSILNQSKSELSSLNSSPSNGLSKSDKKKKVKTEFIVSPKSTPPKEVRTTSVTLSENKKTITPVKKVNNVYTIQTRSSRKRKLEELKAEAQVETKKTSSKKESTETNEQRTPTNNMNSKTPESNNTLQTPPTVTKRFKWALEKNSMLGE
ncbi:hypothetical protein BB560_006526, partial [Smittium megazygosporum]